MLEPGGLRGDYFNNNTWTAPSTVTRLDGPINFNYNGATHPFVGVTASGYFTVRNFGRVLPTVTANYVFNFYDQSNACNDISATQVINAPAGGTTANGHCSGPAQQTSASTAFTANSLIDYKNEFSNQDSTPETWYLQWNTGGVAPFAANTVISSSYLWAPMPLTGLASLTKFTIAGWLNSKSSAQDSTVILNWLSSAASGVDLRYRSDGSLQLGMNEAATTGGTA